MLPKNVEQPRLLLQRVKEDPSAVSEELAVGER
jgi:hypothetical protein